MNCGFCGEALNSSNGSKDPDLCLDCYRRIFETPADRCKTYNYQAMLDDTSDKFRLLCFKSFIVGFLSFIIYFTFPLLILLILHSIGTTTIISPRKLVLTSLVPILPISLVYTYIKARFYLKTNPPNGTLARKFTGLCLSLLFILGVYGLFWCFTNRNALSTYELDLLWVADFFIISILSAHLEYAFAPFVIGFSTWAFFACYIFGGR
jgi:hypothetical protein